MQPDLESKDGSAPPTLSIPEIRDFQKINAELVSLLDEGHSLVRLEGAEGQRLLASGLTGPWNAVIEIMGTTGPELASGLNASGVVIVARGNTADGAGSGLLNGRLIVLGNAGDATGYAQLGGILVVAGSSGNRAGLRQSGGILAVVGQTGRLTGECQSGGHFFAHRGRVGAHAGWSHQGGHLVTFQDPNELDFESSRVWREVIESAAPWVDLAFYFMS